MNRFTKLKSMSSVDIRKKSYTEMHDVYKCLLLVYGSKDEKLHDTFNELAYKCVQSTDTKDAAFDMLTRRVLQVISLYSRMN